VAEQEKAVPTSAAEAPPLSGSSQAAILLMAIGEEEAASVLKHMKPEEVQILGEAMTAIQGVSQQQIGSTLDQFVNKVRNESSLGMESASYFKSTLTRALGEDRASNVLSQMEPQADDKGLSALKWMDVRVIAKIIRNEHPQIMATVLSQLSRDKAGEVLDILPERIRADIVMRVVKLDKLHPAALADLNEVITELFENDATVEIAGLGGFQAAAEILNGVSKNTEGKILDALAELDGETVEKIKEGMFIFENLLNVSDRDTQSLLREITNDDLILALKGGSEELQSKIFKNMSSRAAELLKDDLDAKGPVKLSEVEVAQRSILTTAKQLAEDNKISLGGKDDNYV
jgi:flagellar motor switch protein FliG